MVIMFEYILGLMIDQNGNYLSFGQFDNLENEAQYFGYHGRSSLISIYQSGWYQSHKDLGLQDYDFTNLYALEESKEIDNAIYHYFRSWSNLGYIILLNASSIYTSALVGYLPCLINNSQRATLLNLKRDIIVKKNLQSDLYITNKNGNIITIYDLYETIENTKNFKERLLKL